MQTRTNSAVGSSWAKVAATLAIAAAVFSAAMPAVHAQQSGKQATVGAIRLGAYIPVNSDTQQTYGRYYFAGGLDYVFQNNGTYQRDLVSVDYTQYTKGSNELRVIPVTLGQESLNAPRDGTQEYFSYGVGAYFVHVKNPTDASFGASDTVNQTAFGGYLGGGIDLGSNLFLDARYHIVTPVKGVNTDSLEVTAGLRF